MWCMCVRRPSAVYFRPQRDRNEQTGGQTVRFGQWRSKNFGWNGTGNKFTQFGKKEQLMYCAIGMHQ